MQQTVVKKQWHIVSGILIGALTLVIFAGTELIYMIYFTNHAIWNPLGNATIQFIGMVVSLAFLLTFIKLSKGNFKNVLGLHAFQLPIFIYCLLAMIILMTIIIVASKYTVNSYYSLAARSEPIFNPWVIFSYLIIYPLFQEIICRGFLYYSIDQQGKYTTLAILLPALLWVFTYWQALILMFWSYEGLLYRPANIPWSLISTSFLSLTWIFLYGTLLGIVRKVSGSLYPCIILSMLTYLSTLILPYLPLGVHNIGYIQL